MTGLMGGTVIGKSLKKILNAMWQETLYEDTYFEDSPFGVGHRHHGNQDSGGRVHWQDQGRAGVIEGAISNWGELQITDDELFDRILKDPSSTLATLEGPFTLVAYDSPKRRLVLATDKLGGRPLYYTTTNGFYFGSDLTAMLKVIDDPVIDEQAVSDLLLIGHMWGDKTLLTDVRAVRPATVLEYEHGDVSTTRYWKPSYNRAKADDNYIFELAKRFQVSADRISTTIDGDAGLWLSGGLDSRITASELARNRGADGAFDNLITYTYDSNPPGGVNPRLASRVASTLGVPNDRVKLSIDQFVSGLDDAVRITDGMLQWNTLFNLSAATNLDSSAAGVIMEGLEGSLLGRHLNPYHFNCESPVESMYLSERKRDLATVEELLAIDVDPLASFRHEVEWSSETSFSGIVMDAHFQNYYARMAFQSNKLPRRRVGTRVPYIDGPFLEQAARMPLSFREKTFPFTGGKIPFGLSEPKLKMIRLLNTDLARIPYEKTRLPPTYPFTLHVAGFVATTGINRVKKNYTYGGPSLFDDLYRGNDAFRAKMNLLLDDACDRPYFDEDFIKTLQDEHLRDKGDHVGKLAPVTTIELWLQSCVDKRARTPAQT